MNKIIRESKRKNEKAELIDESKSNESGYARERERETDRQTDRQRQRQKETERETEQLNK